MKKPNYGFEKRKKEMKRQKKNEEKRMRRLNKDAEKSSDNIEQPPLGNS